MKKQSNQPHELAMLIPYPREDQWKALCQSIKKHGLRNPIVTYEGKILDGRARLTCCHNVHVEPVFTGYTGDDPLEYVLDRNLYKRHLSRAQKKKLENDILNYRERENIQAQRLGLGRVPKETMK